jgi:hypothetical protein
MGSKPNFLYNTDIRRSSEVLFLTGKLCILEEINTELGLLVVPYFSQNGKAHFRKEALT